MSAPTTYTVSSLPTDSNRALGVVLPVTDADSPKIGEEVSSRGAAYAVGSQPALVWWNGLKWTVCGV